MQPDPKPVLQPGIIYSGDNGRLICLHCAGMMALYTGNDLSGHPVTPMTAEDNATWLEEFHEPLACEAGCTKFGGEVPPDERPAPRAPKPKRPKQIIRELPLISPGGEPFKLISG